MKAVLKNKLKLSTKNLRFLLNKNFLILAVILIIGLFLRSYRVFESFAFGIDADLLSWIVKDILIDHHLRLIGQETSTPGIFVGPLFYYLLTPFYLLTGFHPTSSIYLGLIISMITILSYYFVFRKLFDQTTGLIAAFLQAVIHYRGSYDRWIVPTITVNLWCIWYFFTIAKLSQGNLNYLALAGLLTGLIWHIHIALAPTLILIPLAVIISKKIPSLKHTAIFLGSFILPMLPFFVFEVRHGFSQSRSFVESFFYEPINVYSDHKIDDVLRLSFGSNYSLNVALLIILLFLPRLKIVSYKVVLLLFIWLASTIAFFTLTKKLISEYYFESFRTITLVVIILSLSFLIKSSKNRSATINRLFRIIGIAILLSILIYSINYFTRLPLPGNGYVARSKVIEYIKNDAVAAKYPCVSVTYITTPGEELGYRYLYWFGGIRMAKPGDGIPNYTIVSPYNLSTEAARFRYGNLNVIPPDKQYNLEEIKQICPEVDYNQTALFWGFTK